MTLIHTKCSISILSSPFAYNNRRYTWSPLKDIPRQRLIRPPLKSSCYVAMLALHTASCRDLRTMRLTRLATCRGTARRRLPDGVHSYHKQLSASGHGYTHLDCWLQNAMSHIKIDHCPWKMLEYIRTSDLERYCHKIKSNARFAWYVIIIFLTRFDCCWWFNSVFMLLAAIHLWSPIFSAPPWP